MKAKRTVGLIALLASMSVFLFAAESMAADPRNGAKIYNIHCANCHGSNGAGAMPGMPDFRRGQSLFKNNAFLVLVLEEGRGIMPAYRGLLTTQEMLDVIAHLRTFQ